MTWQPLKNGGHARFYSRYKTVTLTKDKPLGLHSSQPILIHRRTFVEVQFYWDPESNGERIVGFSTFGASLDTGIGLDSKGWGFSSLSQGILYHEGKEIAPFFGGFTSGTV